MSRKYFSAFLCNFRKNDLTNLNSTDDDFHHENIKQSKQPAYRINNSKVQPLRTTQYFKPLSCSEALTTPPKPVDNNTPNGSPMPQTKLSRNAIRFIKFASVQNISQEALGKNFQIQNLLRNSNQVTVQDPNLYFMTANDFIDCITKNVPTQSEKVSYDISNSVSNVQKFDHIIRDMQLEYAMHKKYPNDILSRINQTGLISYSDYVFLLTLLSKTEHSFHLAFNLLDHNSDNFIDYEEFEKLESFMCHLKTHSEHNSEAESNNSGKFSPNDLENFHSPNLLKKLFFGVDGHRTLSFERFKTFTKAIQFEVLKSEFDLLKEMDWGLFSVFLGIVSAHPVPSSLHSQIVQNPSH